MIGFEENSQEQKAKILVIGVGGGGCNAVDRMIEEGLSGVEFLAINTDAQALKASKADSKLQIGEKLTNGLGAGGNPQVGVKSAEESIDSIVAEIERADMVFVTAGMGGGTGTGAAPVIATAATEMGILTVGVVSSPFEFEGLRRKENANIGINNLKKSVDSIVIVPNDKLLEVAGEDMSLLDAFSFADSVLKQGVRGITDLVSKRGLVNLDFADVEAVLRVKGVAHMGIGRGEGENAAEEATRNAIKSPLLETSVEGAKSLLVNITGGYDITMQQVTQANNMIYELVDENANIVSGTAIDSDMQDAVEVTVIATGFGSQDKVAPLKPMFPNNDRDSSDTAKEANEDGRDDDDSAFTVPDFLKKL